MGGGRWWIRCHHFQTDYKCECAIVRLYNWDIPFKHSDHHNRCGICALLGWSRKFHLFHSAIARAVCMSSTLKWNNNYNINGNGVVFFDVHDLVFSLRRFPTHPVGSVFGPSVGSMVVDFLQLFSSSYFFFLVFSFQLSQRLRLFVLCQNEWRKLVVTRCFMADLKGES